MKTIKQISKELTEQIMFNERHINFVLMGQDIAKRTIEEVQRWIPIEEELPPLHEDVLLKCESSFIDKGCLIHLSGDNMFSSSSGDLDIVTHWRPINFL